MKSKFYVRVLVIGIVMMSLVSTSVFAFRSKNNYTIPDRLFSVNSQKNIHILDDYIVDSYLI